MAIAIEAGEALSSDRPTASQNGLNRDGREALTLRAAARMAGVSQTAPYRHFPDKDSLVTGVAEDGLRALAACMQSAGVARGDDAAEQLQALGVAYVTFAARHPAQFRVMFSSVRTKLGAYPSLREASDSVFALLLSAISKCQRAGLVDEGDPHELALAAWSIVHGLADLAVGGQVPRAWRAGKGLEGLAEAVTARLFRGLAAERAVRD